MQAGKAAAALVFGRALHAAAQDDWTVLPESALLRERHWTFFAAQGVFGRLEKGVPAVMTAPCTHAGCRVAWKDGGFSCPFHGSRFDAAGVPVKGPAARRLARHPARRNRDGTCSARLSATL